MSETRRKNSARFDPRWNFNNWAGGRWKCVDSKITLHSTFSHITEYWGYVKVSSWPSLAGPSKFDANIYVAGRKIFLLTSKLEPNNVYLSQTWGGGVTPRRTFLKWSASTTKDNRLEAGWCVGMSYLESLPQNTEDFANIFSRIC